MWQAHEGKKASFVTPCLLFCIINICIFLSNFFCYLLVCSWMSVRVHWSDNDYKHATVLLVTFSLLCNWCCLANIWKLASWGSVLLWNTIADVPSPLWSKGRICPTGSARSSLFCALQICLTEDWVIDDDSISLWPPRGHVSLIALAIKVTKQMWRGCLC